MNCQLFNDGDKVKLKKQADWKYNNRREGTRGVIFDCYCSDKSGEYVYEIDFIDSLDLIHQADLELID